MNVRKRMLVKIAQIEMERGRRVTNAELSRLSAEHEEERVHMVTISKIKSGKTRHPDIATLQKLTRALRTIDESTPTDYFFREDWSEDMVREGVTPYGARDTAHERKKRLAERVLKLVREEPETTDAIVTCRTEDGDMQTIIIEDGKVAYLGPEKSAERGGT